MCLSSEYIMYVNIVKLAISVFLHRLIMGDATCLTRPQMACIKNPRYTKCEHPGVCYFPKVSSPWERLLVIALRCKFVAFCDRTEIYFWLHRSVTRTKLTWPDLKIKKNVWLEWGVSHAKCQLSNENCSGAIARKPCLGCPLWPPRFN